MYVHVYISYVHLLCTIQLVLYMHMYVDNYVTPGVDLPLCTHGYVCMYVDLDVWRSIGDHPLFTRGAHLSSEESELLPRRGGANAGQEQPSSH